MFFGEFALSKLPWNGNRKWCTFSGRLRGQAPSPPRSTAPRCTTRTLLIVAYVAKGHLPFPPLSGVVEDSGGDKQIVDVRPLVKHAPLKTRKRKHSPFSSHNGSKSLLGFIISSHLGCKSRSRHSRKHIRGGVCVRFSAP